MIRLSAALTRFEAPPATLCAAGVAVVMTGDGVAVIVLAVMVLALDALALNADRSAKRSADGPLGGKLGIAGCNAGLDESSQDSIEFSNVRIMKACGRNAKQCFEMK